MAAQASLSTVSNCGPVKMTILEVVLEQVTVLFAAAVQFGFVLNSPMRRLWGISRGMARAHERSVMRKAAVCMAVIVFMADAMEKYY